MLFRTQSARNGFLRTIALHFGALILLLAAGAYDVSAQQKKLKPIKVGLSTPSMGTTFCMLPLASELGFFEDEGFSVEIPLVAGSSAVIQLVIAGSVDVAVATPETVFRLAAEGADITLAYNFVRVPAASLAVLADSPYHKLEDLRGKSIGAQSLASGNIMLSNVGFDSVGVNYKSDIKYIAVGVGAQALHALQSKHVEALTLWDSAYADMERQGAKLRYLRTPLQERLFTTSLVTRRSAFDGDGAIPRGVGRAVAKATYVASQKPEACVRAMWKMFPTTKPTGASQADDTAYQISVVQRRIPLLMNDGQEKNGFGSFPVEDVKLWNETAIKAGIATKKVEDIGLLYSNRFVPEYNAWDRAEALKRTSRLD